MVQKQSYNDGMLPLLLLLLSANFTHANDLKMTAKLESAATIGKLAQLELEIENLSSEPITIIEIDPQQPCEEPILLIRSLYGSIQYVKENDEYIYDPLKQSQTSIPISEGMIAPGEKLVLEVQYRPFAQREKFEIQYAQISTEPVYKKASDFEGVWHFNKNGTDSKMAILPSLSQMKKDVAKVEVVIEGVEGEESAGCYCELLKRTVDKPPFSLYKEWDAGKTVEFRVGDQQEGIGSERKSAGWKFLNQYEVVYGDGMYMHGEYIRISPEQASEFWKQIETKYSIKRINYFFDDHYYDLEPLS
jgi:hypothetical protein